MSVPYQSCTKAFSFSLLPLSTNTDGWCFIRRTLGRSQTMNAMVFHNMISFNFVIKDYSTKAKIVYLWYITNITV